MCNWYRHHQQHIVIVVILNYKWLHCPSVNGILGKHQPCVAFSKPNIIWQHGMDASCTMFPLPSAKFPASNATIPFTTSKYDNIKTRINIIFSNVILFHFGYCHYAHCEKMLHLLLHEKLQDIVEKFRVLGFCCFPFNIMPSHATRAASFLNNRHCPPADIYLCQQE